MALAFPISRPELTDKRTKCVDKFIISLQALDLAARSTLLESLENKTAVSVKVDGKNLYIKPNTPTWINLVVAFDGLYYTRLFAKELESGLVNAKGNYFRKSQISSSESDDNSKDTNTTKDHNVNKSKTPKSKKETKKVTVGQLKIGKTIIKFTGDLGRVEDLVRELVDSSVIQEKLPKDPKTKKAEVPVVESDSDSSAANSMDQTKTPHTKTQTKTNNIPAVKIGPKALDDYDSDDDSDNASEASDDASDVSIEHLDVGFADQEFNKIFSKQIEAFN